MKSLFLFLALATQNLMAGTPVMDYVQQYLPSYGTLRHSGEFVYLDVDDAYIHQLIGLIEQEGFVEPPYFGRADLVGAHISVMYAGEMTGSEVMSIEEFNQVIHFVPKNAQVVHPTNWKGIDEVYFISVEAPELDAIREKYGLPKSLYDFHITIGVKPKVAKSA